jgi:hypothetical protein
MIDSPAATALDAAMRKVIADNPDGSAEEHHKIFRDVVSRDPVLRDALLEVTFALLHDFDTAFAPWVGENARPN